MSEGTVPVVVPGVECEGCGAIHFPAPGTAYRLDLEHLYFACAHCGVSKWKYADVSDDKVGRD